MAINFLNTVNLNKNQLTQAAIESQPSDALVGAAPVEGQIYFNTTDFDLRIYANGAWKEVGATSGVETLSSNDGTASAGKAITFNDQSTGNVVVNVFEYAGGANVGYVPKDGLVDQYLDGTGAWVDVTTGDIESVTESAVLNRLGIRITTPTGPDPVVGLDIIGQTNLGTTPAANDELIIYDTSTVTNKSITVENLVGGYETTYTIDVPAATTNINLKGTDGAGTVTNDPITLSGTIGQTAITRINDSQLRVALTDDVTIVDDLFVGGVITQTGIGSTTGVNDGALTASTALLLTANNTAIKVGMQVTGTGIPTNITIATVTDAKTFVLSGVITITNGITITFEEVNSFAAPLDMNNNRIHEVKTGVLGTDGVNLGQVELLVAGVGVFKGGYDADTGLTVPGGLEIDGASNIALDKGDYFVVTVAGSAFFSLALEPGDFIFAETAIAANSSPPVGDYIVVRADDNVAGAGATDGATPKGVSGFDSANFTVSSNGWVQLKPQSNPYGASIVLNSGDNSTAGQTTFTVDVTNLFGSGAVAANCKAEVVTTTGRLTVYPEVTGNGFADLIFEFMPQQSNGTYTALIQYI